MYTHDPQACRHATEVYPGLIPGGVSDVEEIIGYLKEGELGNRLTVRSRRTAPVLLICVRKK